MNPLCCIAPVSLDKETGNGGSDKGPSSTGKFLSLSLSPSHASFLGDSHHERGVSLSPVSGRHHLYSTHLSFSDDYGNIMSREGEESAAEGSVNVVAGVLFKWVNYGKGWRPRWFVLRDGVLSYYKVHGPDKIDLVGEFGRVRIIGEESVRRIRKKVVPNQWGGTVISNNGTSVGTVLGHAKKWKSFGEIHLKVSSVRASKSDDKRLSIFTGTKTLHLRCEAREDRSSWIDSLLSAKDLFPRILTSNDFPPAQEITISTEKLRSRLLQEGISELAIKDCESVMLNEVSELQCQLNFLRSKHISLIERLRQLETDKVELETTVVDETKGRESFASQANGRFSDFYSVLSTGSASDSDVDNESQEADGETDDDDVIYFDTMDYLSAESLRSASYRSREVPGNVCSDLNAWDKGLRFSDLIHESDSRIKTIDFPYVIRRDKLPEPKEKEKPVGLWSIIKENIGKDLSGICLPVYFNEPLSSLQKCFEDLEYSYLVDQALEWGKQGNGLMRILSVAAFAISGYASTEGRQCKPFNPLLGETYEADYPDKGIHFFSEKVSHHPMIVACHCDGRGWKFWADSNIKGKFWGRSIQLDPIGTLTLQFEDGEMFQWSKVTTSIYNIILGKIYCDHYGTMRIRGSGNYSCKLKFKEQSIIDRNPHQVQGFVQDNRTGNKVAMLVGKWDEAMYYVLGDPSTKPKGYDPMSDAILLWERDISVTQTRYNLTPFAISLNELTPELVEKLPPTDSRLRPDQRHLENGEYELANAEKLRLEQLQRQARRMQEKGWQPRWFRKDKEDDCYRYIGGYWEAREKMNWGGIPSIFGKGDTSLSVEE